MLQEVNKKNIHISTTTSGQTVEQNPVIVEFNVNQFQSSIKVQSFLIAQVDWSFE